MAGGPHAAAIPCWRCAERAERVREGLETDTFLCGSCGFTITLDFDESGPLEEPLWPPTPEQRAEILKAAEARDKR